MYNGDIKPVEQIREGELVMGADSKPRRVSGLTHGMEEMFKVTPVKGEPYVVNASHILSLKITRISNACPKHVTDSRGRRYTGGDICNISVRDYLKCSSHFKHMAKGWRTGVDFSSQNVKIPPYILGVWLGDGNSRATTITTMDDEVVDAFTEYCEANSLIIRPALCQSSGKAITYLIKGKYTGWGCNKFKSELEHYQLIQNKHIPHEYLINDWKTRIELLAGLLDADGYIVDRNVFEIATSREAMRDGILFLARSLGFAAYSANKIVNGKIYYRINISGDTHLIPTRIPRRKASVRKQKKNVLHTGIKVEPVGVGEYFGFELEGTDRLFLLGDFTVVHNTVTFSRIPRRGRMLILSHRDELVHQPEKYFDCSFGVEQGSETSHGEEVISASVQSLVHRLDKFRPDEFDVLITDECHHSTAPTYRKIYDYFKPRLHLGFTATPNRNDGVGLKAIYSDIIYERNLRWGIENGYLSNIHCLRVDIGVDLRRVAQRLGDYAPDSLDRAINIESANEAVAEAYRLYAKPPALIFCASVAHAEALAEKIPGAVAVKGGEDRSETVQAFSEGKIPCLTNCMVFTEGTDIPNIQTVIMARPTRNVSLYIQAIGRGCRLYPGKEYLTLIDCVGISEDADLCTAPSLLGLDIDDVPPEQRYKLQGNLFDIPEIITELEDSPEAWIRNVESVDLWARKNKYDMHGVNYFRMPDGSLILSEPRMVIPAEDSLGRILWKGRYEPAQKVFDEVYNILRYQHSENRALWDLNLTRHWGNTPATEKQKALIRRNYPEFDVSTLTKFEAGQILTRHFAEPPTEKQKYVLRRAGYDIEGLSKYDAIQIIRRLKGA